MWMAGLQAEYEFMKRDAVRTSDPKHPGRKEFLCEGFRSKRQLRWRGWRSSSCRDAPVATVNDRDQRSGDKIVFEHAKAICSWPL